MKRRRPSIGSSLLPAMLVAAVSFFVSAQSSLALPQPDAGSSVQRAEELDRAARDAFAAHDYPAAEAALSELLSLTPDNFVVHYNLACAYALQGKADSGAAALVRAVELGFDSLPQITRDPDLAGVRETEPYRALIANWDRVLDLRADANLAAVEKLYGPKYTYIKDDSMRLAFASAFDPTSFSRARAEIEVLFRWGTETIFTDLLTDTDEGRTAAAKDPWVVVILPTRRDFDRWAIATYGAGAVGSFRQIGGQYNHDSKRLIAQDLGGTLRHEFFHILHWRSMSRLRQMHPIWIQEGLCSLVEDYDMDPDGSIRISPSWRTNIAGRLARNSDLFTLEKLAGLDQMKFSNTNPLSNYAQSRAVFMYLLAAGKLGEWYRAYTASYNEDPSGLTAMERVLGKPIKEINADYRAWARELPTVADQLRPGRASLDLDVDGAGGEGLEIIQTPPRAVSRAGLRLGDIITAINDRPTRDVNEMYRILSDYEPGDKVQVAYRRGSKHATTTITLSPRE